MLWPLLRVMLLALLVFHATTYLLWLYEQRAHGAPRPRQQPLPLVAAWLGEGLALLAVVLTWPLGLLGSPRPRHAPNARPVVLVHGWSLNRGSMALLTARLRRDGRDAYAINYPSFSRDMNRKAAHVARELRAILEASGGDRVDVLAHSQGGVVVRAAARDHDVLGILGNVVTLGTPHLGAALAALVPAPGLRQMKPRSRYLERLATEDPVPSAVNFTVIRTTFDAIVFPLELTYYAGAFNVTVDGVGHHGLLLSERIYGLAKENLDVAPRESEGSADARQAAV